MSASGVCESCGNEDATLCLSCVDVADPETEPEVYTDAPPDVTEQDDGEDES